MSTIDVKVPDIGDFKDVPVIQVFVKPGDAVKREDPLVTVESDKASMDIPTPTAGTVREVKVKVGDRVSEGRAIITLDAAEAGAPPASGGVAANGTGAAPQVAAAGPPVVAREQVAGREQVAASPPRAEAAPEAPGPATARLPPASAPIDAEAFRAAHASPSVRRFARELGVDLSQVGATGPKNRIIKNDIERFVKERLAAGGPSSRGAVGLELLPWPDIDFSKHGPVEVKPLSRIQKSSGANLSRNWVRIPHVTQFDEADVTELEALRVRLNEEKGGAKLTLLAFLMKACVAALQRFPELNASLRGDELVLKRYFHLGFAADTPHGLVVPVVRDVDQKGVRALAQELAELSQKARDGKLGPVELSGGTFSISSLGGIGGTAFTPIINAPEVAILGVSRAVTKPVWDGEKFAPRLMLPLSLSYDHRVIDGATAARFTTQLAQLLADLRRALL
jgi:pyruvate dehydrogenase E2 component (dihydrolipoamide acetyltransferase)